MSYQNPRRADLWRGVAVTLLALLPAYFSIEGLITGETRALTKSAYSPHVGAAAVVTAIAYALFAAALVLAAVRFFSANAKRRASLFKWAWNVTIGAIVVFVAGRLVWMFQ